MKIPIFTGASAALVTPFYNDKIDYKSFEALIESQISANSEAVTICGTTGEGATLKAEEYIDIIKFAVKTCGGRCKIIVGSGSNDTAAAIKKSQIAEENGADGLLVVTPYYNKATQSGLISHYEAIAKSVKLPIIVYNVPSRTGLCATAETYKILSEIDNINGVKEASGNMDLIAKTKLLCGNDLAIWSGNDNETVEIMALGGTGVISVAANIIPQVMMDIVDFCDDGEFSMARSLAYTYYELIESMFCEVNPIPIKYILEKCGLIKSGELRLPLTPLSYKSADLIDGIYKKYKSEDLL